MKQPIPIGARIRLTGTFLRSTGQFGEGRSRWIVQAHPGCGLCANGEFVLTDQERSSPEDFTPEEYAADPLLKFRHINRNNVEIVK